MPPGHGLLEVAISKHDPLVKNDLIDRGVKAWSTALAGK